MKKVKGYIFSRSFYGERVPQHIQNLVLREYCKSKKLHFILSSTEYRQDNSTYILFEILHNIKNYDGIIMYSVFQLPEKKVLRNKLYSEIIKKKKSIFFAVEDYVLNNNSDKNKIEEIYLAKQILNNNKKFRLGKLRKFVTPNHLKTKRNYIKNTTR